MPPLKANRIVVLGVGIALALGVGAYVYLAESAVQSEVAYLAAHPELDFEQLSDYFQSLAREKGAPYAFAILRDAPLPPNTDTHLLGHVVGDELYLQQGARGITTCTQDFRNACSHTIVIGVLSDKGEAGLADIAELCKEAPGGTGAYTMCFHGLGHGVFAYEGYDLARTAALCKKTGTPAYNFREYIECFGGAIMELVGGGGHDKELWEEANVRYLSVENPLSPCDTSLVPDDLRPICYTYLTPHLFTQNGGDLGYPGPREFSQAFSFCEEIKREREAERNACFGGIGKELPTLSASRDIRSIDKLSTAQLALVHTWCALAESADGREQCVRSVVQSLFWGGENDPKAAISFCALETGIARAACFDELYTAAEFYLRTNPNARASICVLSPLPEQDACVQKMRL